MRPINWFARHWIALLCLCICFMLGLTSAKNVRSYFHRDTIRTGDFSALYDETKAPVVIFTTSTCPYCQKTRNLLVAQGVTFHDFKIDGSPSNMKRYAAFDAKGRVPLIFIGRRLIVGFQERAILAALKEARTTSSRVQKGPAADS